MYKRILVPIDLADPDLAKPAVTAALMMATPSEGMIRFINVLPLTPVMLAEYVPPDFEVQQRKAAEDALSIVVKETGLPSSHVSSTVRQGRPRGALRQVLGAGCAKLRRLHPGTTLSRRISAAQHARAAAGYRRATAARDRSVRRPAGSDRAGCA